MGRLPDRIQSGDRPQMGVNAEKPGHYEPAIRMASSVIDPGDLLEGEIYITGYGEIEGAKLAFYPSPGVFSEVESRVSFGFKREGDLLTFGGTRSSVSDVGMILDLTGGVQFPPWKRASMFFDLQNSNAPQIASETKQVNAPISFSLRALPSVRPGNYSLQFCLTYFNGESWQASVQSISFTVRTFFQRHERVVAAIALIGALVTIVPGMADTWSAVTAAVRAMR